MRLLCLIFFCVYACITLAQAEEKSPLVVKPIPPVSSTTDHLIEVQLQGGPNGPRMVLLLTAEQGIWQRVWAYAGITPYHGYLVSAEMNATKAHWDIVLHTPGDVYFHVFPEGCFDRIIIDAQRPNPQSDWVASFTINRMVRDPVRGVATVTEFPIPKKRPGYTPITQGEHPRLLFRKSDLPALKARLATPFGQAAKAQFEANKDAASLGVLYQITGDRRYADQAKIPFETELAQQDYGPYNTGQVWAGRLLTVAVAWDCLKEVWDADYNRKIEETLMQRFELLFFNSGGNAAPTSNWAGPRNAAAGMATMLMAGDLGDPPPPLYSTKSGRTRYDLAFSPIRVGIYRADSNLVTEIPPLEGVDGPLWSPGQPFTDWVWSSLITIPIPEKQDLLNGMGGAAKAIPKEGTTCTSTIFNADGENEVVIRFSKVPSEILGAQGLQASSVVVEKKASNAVFSTTFRVASDLAIKSASLPKGVTILIDQEKYNPSQGFILKAGVHRLLLRINLPEGQTLSGRLDPIFEDATKQTLTFQESIRLFGGLERGDWEARGKMDFYKDYLLGMGRIFHYQYCWLGMGEGGFHAESGGYSHHGGYGVYSYALMHWNVFGSLITGRGDASKYIPRHVFQNPIGEQIVGLKTTGRLQGLPIHGYSHPCYAAYGRSFPFLDPAWQPACLYLWQQGMGIDPSQPQASLFKQDALISFLTYPLDMKAEPPSTPTWPLTWSSALRGYYGFRNGFQGAAQDAVLQVYANSSLSMGWSHPDAGALTLQAFGNAWALGESNRMGFRFKQSVVLIDELGHGERYGQLGVVRKYQTEPDGSGTISIDLAGVYGSKEAKDLRIREKNAVYKHGSAVFSSATLAQGRFVAVDYSGKAGCPVVLVLVDRLEDVKNDKKRVWHWNLPPELHSGFSSSARSFTVKGSGATMQTTFAHPANPIIKKPLEHRITVVKMTKKKKAKEDEKKSEIDIEGVSGEVTGVTAENVADTKKDTEERPLGGVSVLGDDHFFSVITITPGESPKVDLQGSGLDSVVRIGKRSYRFDGTQVVMTDVP